MTTGVFRHLDPAAVDPWAKVDADVTSFRRVERKRSVSNIRHHLRHPGDDDDDGFGSDVDVAGFAVYHAPSQTQTTDPAVFFAPDDSDVRDKYYPEVEQLLRDKLGPKVRKVAIFDHTVRHHDPAAPRQPVQQVHVDQTPKAAEARVRRHLPPDEADDLLKTRHQLINVWRPIGHPASDLPLAVIDWRTTAPEDLVKVDLLYPVENRDTGHGDDDRGKERLPDPEKAMDVSNYEARGKQPSDHPSISETYSVLPSDRHKFFYMKDMTPDEAMFIKCFDSWGQGQPSGRDGVAALTPHTAFVDPATPEDARGRQSIEVRCLVFYDE